MNYLVLPPLHLTTLRQAGDELRRELVRQLHRMGQILRARSDPDVEDLHDSFEQLEDHRDRVREAVRQARRSTVANLRAPHWTESRTRLKRRAQSLEQIAFLLQDVGVVLRDSGRDGHQILDASLREATARTFEDLARLLEDRTRRQRRGTACTALSPGVDATEFDDAQSHHLAGLVAVSARRCLTDVSTLAEDQGP